MQLTFRSETTVNANTYRTYRSRTTIVDKLIFNMKQAIYTCIVSVLWLVIGGLYIQGRTF
jgi:hypothetical protein